MSKLNPLKRLIKVLSPLLPLSLMFLSQRSFAEDALADAEPIVKDTYNNSIKHLLYIAEAMAAIVALIFTRNIKHLLALLGMVVFLQVVTRLAGV